MPTIRRALALACVFAFSACGVFNSIAGSGHIVTETRTVSGFTKISLAGTGRLVVDQSGQESLSIETDDNLLPYLTSEVVGGELRLGTKRGSHVSPTRDVVYHVTMKTVEGLSIAGSASIDATRLSGDQLTASASGSGDIKLAGQVHTLRIEIAGSGRYEGADLQSADATIRIAGSGDGVVAVSEKLDVNIAGAGSVEYIGNPTVTQSIAGAGSVHKR
jgi:hypothetical protein